MINWKGCGRKRSWHNLRYSTDIWSEQGTPHKKRTLRTVGIPAETQVRSVTAGVNSNHVSVQPFKAQPLLPCTVYFIAAGALDLLLLRNVQTGSGILTGSYSKGTGFLSGDKAAGA